MVESAAGPEPRRRKFAPEFSQFLEEDNLGEAIKLAEGYKKSHVARVLGGALGEIKPLIQDGSVTVADINSAERAVEREMLMEIVMLKRGLGVLATVGATAPFVGLLGTTMGIVNAFQGMAASGSGGIGAISAGVAEALITTAFGLLVAIPAVWAYNYFADQDRQPDGRDDVLLQGDDRLPDQGRLGRVRSVALHARVQHGRDRPATRRSRSRTDPAAGLSARQLAVARGLQRARWPTLRRSPWRPPRDEVREK